MIVNQRRFWAAFAGILIAGCGNTSFFNPAFVNTIAGGIHPLTPGPGAAFVLVRVVNQTPRVVEFVVSIEELVVARDEDGNPRVDDDGRFILSPNQQTVRLTTTPGGNGNDIGVLFPCRESIITQVGLGENLLPTDAAAFVAGGGAGGATGFGIPAAGLNPLSAASNNFDCGDTIVFRASESAGVAGGVVLESFLLPNSEQPGQFQGPNTFVTYEQFIESQIREDEP